MELVKKKILVIGNSHTAAIGAAVAARGLDFIEVVNSIHVDEATGQKTNNLFPKDLERFAPDFVFCSFGGSEHNVLGLVEAPIRFDFVTPKDPTVAPDRWPVPFGAIRATLKRACRGAFRNMSVLRAHFTCPIYHLCAPPPFLEIGPNAVLPAAFRERLHYGVTPPAIRRKLHEVHSGVLRDSVDEIGIGFIDFPPASADENGFLLPNFWSNEPTHGNRAYGGLIVDQILTAAGLVTENV